MLPEFKQHEYFMNKALQLAKQAYEEDEIPIGALLVSNGLIIGKGYNQVEKLDDATAHAEMLAITAASEYLNSKYLKNSTLYVTIEPCIMCGGAAKWSQISKIVYGAADAKMGFFSKGNHLHSKIEIVPGILEVESLTLLKNFLKEKRN